MFVYKINPMEELKKKGWTRTSLQRTIGSDGRRVLGSQTVQDIADGVVVGIKSLHRICELLERQPGDIFEYIPDDKYRVLKESGYFEKMGIPTPPLEDE